MKDFWLLGQYGIAYGKPVFISCLDFYRYCTMGGRGIMDNRCPQCGAPLKTGEPFCRYCGESLRPAPQAGKIPNVEKGNGWQPSQAAAYSTPPYPCPEQGYPPSYGPVTGKLKRKRTAGILAILLGGLGVHKFYLGRVWMGILYLLFCWTAIPAILGIVEGILYLCCTEEQFQHKYVR